MALRLSWRRHFHSRTRQAVGNGLGAFFWIVSACRTLLTKRVPHVTATRALVRLLDLFIFRACCCGDEEEKHQLKEEGGSGDVLERLEVPRTAHKHTHTTADQPRSAKTQIAALCSPLLLALLSLFSILDSHGVHKDAKGPNLA